MAAVYFHFGKFLFVEEYDEMREAHMRAVRCLDDALPHLDPPGAAGRDPLRGDADGGGVPCAVSR